MPTLIEQPDVQLLLNTSANSLADDDWIRTLRFRNSAPSAMKACAEQGNVASFTQSLKTVETSTSTLRKSERRTILEQLSQLQEPIDQSEDLLSALFDVDLKKPERSVKIEAFIAEQTEETPAAHTLCNALWVLSFYCDKLSSDSLFSLWRWTLQQGQSWMEQRPVCDPEQGLSQLRYLEICLMMSIVFPDLEGSRQLRKEIVRLIRSCIDESTDTDGTPQAQWVPELTDTLTTLSKLTLFSGLNNQKLWNKEYRQRVEGLVARFAGYCFGPQFSFATSGESLDYEKLVVIAQILSNQDSGLIHLWEAMQKQKAFNQKKLSQWSLPDEVHQSDWALLACMRSGWQSPADGCVVLYDSAVPRIHVTVADVPLFQGAWTHTITVDGQKIETTDDWTCTCWFADEEVNFLETVQEIDSSIKVVRQVVFLRDQSQLLLNHVVHAADSTEIKFEANLPFKGEWTAEHDTATREFALQTQIDDSSSSQRVRVYPLSLDQARVEKAAGQIVAKQASLSINQHSSNEKLFSSTMFDWSPQRMHKPVEWARLSVAQDGQLEPLDQAAAFRCRVGRDQWLLYHSLTEPDIPRTVMGLHTPHETVFSKITSKGEIEPIVEVEM